eukprot:Awhi_evm1s12706
MVEIYSSPCGIVFNPPLLDGSGVKETAKVQAMPEEEAFGNQWFIRGGKRQQQAKVNFSGFPGKYENEGFSAGGFAEPLHVCYYD